MIEVQDLTKYFGPTLAVDHVSFKVEKGEIIGLLGPNGSGKTTMMRILTGFFPPTSGRALIGGLDVAEHSLETRRRVGYLPENMVLYPDLSVSALLEFAARVRGLDSRTTRDRMEYAIKICGLAEVRKKLIGKLSKGYRQRVGIAQAILADPEVLILDEPTVGLDPRQVVEIRDLIRSLAGRSTVLLSTHILPEVTMTCRRVVIIDKGRIVAQDTPEKLTAKLQGSEQSIITVAGPKESVQLVLSGVAGVQRIEERVGDVAAKRRVQLCRILQWARRSDSRRDGGRGGAAWMGPARDQAGRAQPGRSLHANRYQRRACELRDSSGG